MLDKGLVTRADDPDNGAQTIYSPTAKAEALRPVLEAMAGWALEFGPTGLALPNSAAFSSEAEPARTGAAKVPNDQKKSADAALLDVTQPSRSVTIWPHWTTAAYDLPSQCRRERAHRSAGRGPKAGE
jgi:hypothetical protein